MQVYPTTWDEDLNEFRQMTKAEIDEMRAAYDAQKRKEERVIRWAREAGYSEEAISANLDALVREFGR